MTLGPLHSPGQILTPLHIALLCFESIKILFRLNFTFSENPITILFFPLFGEMPTGYLLYSLPH